MLLYLTNKTPEINVIILTEINIDISCIAFSTPGFFCCSLCRENYRGSGILVFTHNKWLFTRIDISAASVEISAIELHKRDIPYTLLALYRPPGLSIKLFHEEFNTILKAFNNNKYSTRAGDLNTGVTNPTKAGVNDYFDLLASTV